MYEERFYRSSCSSRGLVNFEVADGQTDLLVCAEKDLAGQSKKIVFSLRQDLKRYIKKHPLFETTFVPIEIDSDAPEIVRMMSDAAALYKVGPMAAVAGAIAEAAGSKLLRYSKQIIIENGGDIFIRSSSERIVSIFAGKSPFTGKIGIRISPEDTPLGICTSSGTVGPSFSFGSSDAVVAISKSAARADAAATAIGNIVINKSDIQKALVFSKELPHILGVLIIKGEDMGSWGKIEIVKI